MKPERLEQLLRMRPPDEPTYRGDLLLGPRLARPTRSRSTGRRPFAGALGAVALGVVVVVLAVAVAGSGQLAQRSTVGPSASPIPTRAPASATSAQVLVPWIDATPAPSPTPEPTPDPRSYPACAAGDLVLVAGGWDGATGSLAGGADVVNMTANPCVVTGRPKAELLDAQGRVIAPADAPSAGDPNAAPVVLQPGGVAGVILAWSNWCGAQPKLPLSVRLALPDRGGTLTATVRESSVGAVGAVPRCDSPGGGSSLGVPLAFSAPEPSSGGYQPAACTADALTGYLGAWGFALGTSYARLVVFNAGPVDCLLDSAPTFELRDAAGRRLVVARAEPLPASAATILLPAGWAAVATMGFSDWCTADPQTPLHADAVVSSGRLAIDALSPIPVPTCISAQGTPPTLFYASSFATPGTPTAPEPDPIDSLPVSVSLSVLPPTAPGAVLDYSVTLTNTDAYGKPINLAALCPAYTQRLILPGDGGTIETPFALNCAPAGVLEAGGRVTFSMRLAVPADALPGVATLVWQLGARGPAAKATFQIQPK